jgi:hypothetical protein
MVLVALRAPFTPVQPPASSGSSFVSPFCITIVLFLLFLIQFFYRVTVPLKSPTLPRNFGHPLYAGPERPATISFYKYNLMWQFLWLIILYIDNKAHE